MVSKANIYVSVTRSTNGKGEGYHRPLHTWLVSVEPHHGSKFHIRGTSHKDPEPIHYGAAKNEETGIYTINTHPHDSEPAIIGNILIAEEVSTSDQQVHKLLEEELGESSKRTVEDRRSSGQEAEYWIEHAIRALQKRKLMDAFGVEQFMTFAHAYEANRMDGEGQALVAYPRAHKEPEKKASKHKFWVSHPMANRTRTNGHGEASVYGGLM
ncbi:uncharacterized protein LTR77_004277 [Saxophila tyrrhenica]|uniref:Uncharacterized protein n=1 Tax=Saxophila tyrrhenica TaxID=1690608 RepID=A0AAV9PGJ4_9PEZI|nr:hypothetical protein LTR77_004277 [Saxophila tyrrhenica]